MAGKNTSRTRTAAAETDIPDDARLVADALAAGFGVVAFRDLHRVSLVDRMKVRPAVAGLVQTGRAVVILDHVVSLVPPARLDHPEAPVWLRVLAAVAVHGSVAQATGARAVPAGQGTFRAVGRLLRNGLLAQIDGALFVPEGPEAEALRRLWSGRADRIAPTNGA